MKDLGWLPPKIKRSRYRLVRRRTLLTLALVATLATSAVVVQQWVWSGRNPNKTLDLDKALIVINNPKEHEDKRNAAYLWLYAQMLRSLKTMKEWEKSAPSKHKGDATYVLNQIEKAARVK
jgi:hypothetical protein